MNLLLKYRASFGYLVVGFSDFEIGVFVATDIHGPPAFEVVGDGAGANSAKAVLIGEVFDLYDRFHLFLADKSFSQNCTDNFFLAELRRQKGAESRREMFFTVLWVLYVWLIFKLIDDKNQIFYFFFCETLRFFSARLCEKFFCEKYFN